jgi:hypothetical protein
VFGSSAPITAAPAERALEDFLHRPARFGLAVRGPAVFDEGIQIEH